MKTFISIILLTVSVSLFSQNTKIDSLQQKLIHARGNDSILVLNDLAYAYGYVDFNKSISLAKEALILAETQKYNKAKALTYDILGRAYFISGNNKVAEEYYNKCIETANKYGTKDDIYKALRHKILLIYTLLCQNGSVKDSTESMHVYKQYINMTIEKNDIAYFKEGLQFFVYVFYSQKSGCSIINDYFTELLKLTKGKNEFLPAIYANEGLFYKLKFDYFRAIEKYMDALKLTKNIPLKTNYFIKIGDIYFEVRKYKESIRYYNNALQLITNKEYELNLMLYYTIEANLGACYLQLNDNRTALSHFQTALQSPFLTKKDKGILYHDLGQAYLSVDSLDKAELFIDKAIATYDSLNIKNEKLGVLGGKAKLLTRRQQWTQLPEVINEISALANDVKEYYVLYDCYQLLSDYYEKSGNYKKSNEYLKKWITANDSINNRELVNKMSEMRFTYETEEKEQQISIQKSIIKQKDKLIVLSVIAGSLIFAALFVIFILYKIKNKAYRLLVYQSLENTSNAQLVKIIDHANEEDTIENSNSIPALDEKLKNQIEISLNKQLDAKVYLEQNLLLKTLAKRCDTNRSYLSQFINERYNTNFNTFINTLRINEAKQIISDRNNDIPLKELYLRLGYNTYSVFNEAFKKHVGVTPNFFLKTVKDLLEVSNLQ